MQSKIMYNVYTNTNKNSTHEKGLRSLVHLLLKFTDDYRKKTWPVDLGVNHKLQSQFGGNHNLNYKDKPLGNLCQTLFMLYHVLSG